MSDFTDFCSAGYTDAFTVIGTTSFTYRNVSRSGIFSQVEISEEYQIGGAVPNLAGSLMFALTSFNPPIREGETVLIGDRYYLIAKIEIDEVTITLLLADNPSFRLPAS